ncbi:hypothetical protein SLA2020_307790 [Shorea laevis]
MASSDQHLLHFVLFPRLAQGHQIPMIDLGRLLAQGGVVFTIITTPINAAKFRTTIDRAVEAGLWINLLEVPFPSSEAGLPQGCDSMDALPSQVLMKNLLLGIQLLQQPVEQLFDEMQPRPSCIIADTRVVWSLHTANKLGIPRVVFDGNSCFSLLCTENILATNIHETVSESETFAVLGLPDRIELTKAQLRNGIKMLNGSDLLRLGIREAEVKRRGILIRGWAPQVLILYHPATGGFLTHCGWNSTLEAVTAGIPTETWPMFTEQLYNEGFIVQVAKIGVSLGSKVPIRWGNQRRLALPSRGKK